MPAGLQVGLSDANGGERRRGTFRLRIPELALLGVAKVADVVVRYTAVGDEIASHELTLALRVNTVSADEAGAAGPDEEVVEEVVILNSARARKDARKHAQEGDFPVARNILSRVAGEFRRFSERSSDPQRFLEEAADLENFATTMEGGACTAAASKLMHNSARDMGQRRIRCTDELERLVRSESGRPSTEDCWWSRQRPTDYGSVALAI